MGGDQWVESYSLYPGGLLLPALLQQQVYLTQDAQNFLLRPAIRRIGMVDCDSVQ